MRTVYCAPMDATLLIVLLLTLLLASYWQSVTGFAMGMIAIAVLGGFRLLDIPTATAVVSALSLFNACLALRGQTRHISRQLVGYIALGQLPAIVVGVWLLTALDREVTWLLELLLGVFITSGSLSMMLRPEPRATLSSPPASLMAGIAGGIVGGMFSASGPVLGWFAYRQPLPLVAIRASLLACFAMTTSTRTVAVGFGCGLTAEVLIYTAAGLPVVALGTWLGRNYVPEIPERRFKQIAFAVLVALGLWICVNAVLNGVAA